MELQLEQMNSYERYYKRYCGVCGNKRLCYAIIQDYIKHGYICRNCNDKLKKELI